MAGTAGEALTTAAVETIARGGGLVAGRAGGHRPTLPPAPHDFADSRRNHDGQFRRAAKLLVVMRWVTGRVVLGALGAGFVTAIAGMALFRSNPGWMYDLKVYRDSAAIIWRGGDLYPAVSAHPFTYPPFAGLLLLPLLAAPPEVDAIAWTALSAACLAVTVWICLRWAAPALSGPKRIALILLGGLAGIWLDPVAATLLAGQVNLFLLLLVVADLAQPESHPWKGAGIGLATAVKLTPALFIVFLVATGRIRAALVAAASFAATVLIGFLVRPADSLRYWSGTFLESSRVGDAQNIRSQSIQSLVVRWTHDGAAGGVGWLVLAALVAVAALLLAAKAHRRGDELLAACTCGAGALLVSPITWQHHWVWVLPILVWLGCRAVERRSGWLGLAAVLIAADFYARPYAVLPVDRGQDLRLDFGSLLLASTYAVGMLLFLGVAALELSRSPSPRPVPVPS